VALNYQSNTTEWESNKKKQVTSTSSTLIRTVLFKPKPMKPSPPHPSMSSKSCESVSIEIAIPVNAELVEEEEVNLNTTNVGHSYL
jgi:hypothetical protein